LLFVFGWVGNVDGVSAARLIVALRSKTAVARIRTRGRVMRRLDTARASERWNTITTP
jgi:hypothetical protein